MIIIKPNSSGIKYSWCAWYGDRYLLATSADHALQLAWAVWGGNIAALVYA